MRKPPEDGPVDRIDAAARAAATVAAGEFAKKAGLPTGVAEAAVAWALGFLNTPVQRRRDRWLTDFASALEELRRRVGKLEDFENNDAFLDIVFAATPVAMREASDKKRHALRNAIVNAGLLGSQPEDRDQACARMCIRLIDELDDLHMHLLEFLANPHGYLEERGEQVESTTFGRTTYQSLGPTTGFAFREFRDNGLVSVAVDDLVRRGLVEFNPSVECHRGASFLRPLGQSFLKFIKEPPPQ